MSLRPFMVLAPLGGLLAPERLWPPKRPVLSPFRDGSRPRVAEADRAGRQTLPERAQRLNPLKPAGVVETIQALRRW